MTPTFRPGDKVKVSEKISNGQEIPEVRKMAGIVSEIKSKHGARSGKYYAVYNEDRSNYWYIDGCDLTLIRRAKPVKKKGRELKLRNAYWVVLDERGTFGCLWPKKKDAVMVAGKRDKIVKVRITRWREK